MPCLRDTVGSVNETGAALDLPTYVISYYPIKN